jgi:RNA polymerase sigma-70 factor (ECF subfamily)
MSLNSNGSGEQYALGIEHIDHLYSYAMVLTHNRAEAEDLVQETYVRALGANGRLRPDSNVKAWLFTILRNVWLNVLRSRVSGPRLVEIDNDQGTANVPAGPSQNPYVLYAAKAEREQVRGAVQRLPAVFREVIVLREYEGLSYEEIARILGSPVGTVMSRLGRARSRLRVLLSEMRPTSPMQLGPARKEFCGSC